MIADSFTKRWHSFKTLTAISVVGLTSFLLAAQSTPSERKSAIREMDKAFQDLAKRVSPAVVKVEVTGYGASEENSPLSPVSRQRSLGAGIIVEPEGYIITNYHVIKGADHVRVVLTPPPTLAS